VIIAEDYDHTKKLKPFNKFLHFFEYSSQKSNPQLETRYFDTAKVF